MNGEDKTRRRIQTACEACRATKIRCQPSEKPGICRKCHESKRECISRTGPRIRRSNRAKPPNESDTRPPLNPPSSTFSIDFEIAAQDEAEDSFDILRASHEKTFESILPPMEHDQDDEYSHGDFDFSAPPSHGLGRTMPTPPASSTAGQSRSIEELHGKPQFNLASAESLLESFRVMLHHLPCIALPADATVPQLASQHPFLLLAILAAASGSRTLQGHSLYDAEFRKVLGLKFVAGGERTLELLQGLVIYCAWYPFHLRPKNKQVFHYIRMANDLVHDLELDQEPAGFDMTNITDDIMDGMRAYLSHTYIAACFTVAWRKYKDLSLVLTTWTQTCCDVLTRHSRVDGDCVLATLVRLSNVVGDASSAIHDPQGQTEQQRRLIMLGLESQAQAVQQQIPSHITSSTPVIILNLFTDLYIAAGALTMVPRPRHAGATSALLPTPSKLAASVSALCRLLEYFIHLDRATAFALFTAADWGRFTLVVVLAVRLSFKTPECPQFDHVRARRDLKLRAFLDHMCEEDRGDLVPSSRQVDVFTATRVVLKVVRQKYDRRVEIAEAVEAAEAQAEAARQEQTQAQDTPAVRMPLGSGCPMLDGSLEQFFPIWDPSLPDADLLLPPTPVNSGSSATRPVFHDLWATMTMGWANEDDQ